MFMRSSTREANLQALLEDNSKVHSHVGDLVDVYKGILAKDVRRTCLAHMIDAVHLKQQTGDIAYDGNSVCKSSLPDDILAAFGQFLRCKHPELKGTDTTEGSSAAVASLNAKVLDKFSLCGVKFSTASRRARDSHVSFRTPLLQPEMCKPPHSSQPGQITHILFHSHAHTPCCHASPGQCHHQSVYVCVRPYASLQPTLKSELKTIDQTYRQFGFAGGFSCRNDFTAPIIIEPSGIISHIAVTPLTIGGHTVKCYISFLWIGYDSHQISRARGLIARPFNHQLMQTMHSGDIEVDNHTSE